MELTDILMLPNLHCEIAQGKIKCHSKFVHWDLLNEIPGVSFKGSGHDFVTLPLSWVSLVCLSRSFEDLTLSPELTEWAEAYYTNVIEPCTLLRTGEGEGFVTDELLADIAALMPAERSPIEPRLRRYQVAAALLLATAQRFILLDEQGTGKMTEVATTLSLYPDTLPALIVAPGNTHYTWQRELAVFGLESVILEGTPAQRRKIFETFDPETGPSIMITSYGLVSKHSRVLGHGNIKLTEEQRQEKELNGYQWASVTADEAHRIKDPDSVQTRAVWGVRRNAKYRWALTGTPIEKSPTEFWALLHFIDPDAWPSSVKMRDRWVQTAPSFYGPDKIIGMRHDRIDEWKAVTEWMWRRKMMEGLPPVSREIRYCELVGKAATAYKSMKKQLMAEVGETDTVLFAQNHMVKAGRLRIMAQGPVDTLVEVDDKGNELITVIPVEKSPKLDLLMETLEDWEGTPLIVWFKSIPLMRLAEARLDKADMKYTKIDGSMANAKRDEAGQAFQRGDVDIILCSVSAASEGVTLTRAPARIIVDRDWSLIKNNQKDKRNERIGSEIHDELYEINLVTRDTIEVDQMEDLLEKEKMRDAVISPFSAS